MCLYIYIYIRNHFGSSILGARLFNVAESVTAMTYMTAVTFKAKPLAGRVRSMVGMVCVASQCFFQPGMPTTYSMLFTPFLRSVQYDGIFVMDSILNVHGNRHWAQYLAEILYVLQGDQQAHPCRCMRWSILSKRIVFRYVDRDIQSIQEAAVHGMDQHGQ